MLSTVDRLLAREIGKTLLAVVSILLLILSGNRLIVLLALAAEGSISGDAVFTLLGLKTIRDTGLLLAPALFFSIQLTLARMYRDQEMTVLAACGFGMLRQYRAVLVVAIPVTALVAFLSLAVIPWAEHHDDRIRAHQEQFLELTLLNPGQFSERREGRVILYVEQLSEDQREMQGVFSWSIQGDRPELLFADRGYQYVDAESGARFVMLLDGHRYQGAPGDADLRIVRFRRNAIRVSEPAPVDEEIKHDSIPTSQLLRSGDRRGQAELQWRLSVPLTALILAGFAVPFSRVAPRSARYGRLLPAVLIYFVYSNFQAMAQSWMKHAITPPWIGIWWVHVVMLCVVAFTLYLQVKPRRQRFRVAWPGRRR